MSVDGMMVRGAGMPLKKIGSKLTQNRELPYYKAQNYVNSRMSIAIVRATHHCLRGPRVPPRLMSYACFPCEDGVGIGFLWTEEG